MKVRFGSFTHAIDECDLSISRRSQYDDRGHRWAIVETWTIQGFLQAADAPALSLAIGRLEAGYAKSNGASVALLFDDGVATKHQMLRQWLWGGVKVLEGPSYPTGAGAEYTTYRSFRVVLEGTHLAGKSPLLTEQPQEILQWTETLTISGTGGPRFIILPTLNGPPQKQTVQQKTVCRASQAGHAVGRTGYPSPPGPMFPDDEHVDQREFSKDAPQHRDGDKYDFAASWRYVFESIGPLGGNPGEGPA